MISLTSRYFEGSVYLHPAFCVGVFIDVFSQAFAAVLNTPSDSRCIFSEAFVIWKQRAAWRIGRFHVAPQHEPGSLDTTTTLLTVCSPPELRGSGR